MVLNHIKQFNAARAIWDFVDSIYLHVTPMKRVSLEVELRCLDLATFTSIREHINKMQNYHQDILHAGKEISSEDIAITLLG